MARPDGERPVQVTPRVDDISRARAQGAIAVIPVIENGYGIGTDLGNVERFAKMGVRYMTLTHNGHNAIGDAAIPRGDLGDAPFLHGGLSAFGREVVAECNRTGILVDISHTSRETMLQAAEISKVPVVASHSCVCALCNHPRNLDDLQLDVIRERGGVAQITAVPFFVRPHGRAETVRVGDFVDHIDYAVRRMGIAHVGISSDFDGGGGFDGCADHFIVFVVIQCRGFASCSDRNDAGDSAGNLLLDERPEGVRIKPSVAKRCDECGMGSCK
jgi:membrane dipeptidase